MLMNGEEAPESPDDFDRLIIGSPNSSYLWIKYIAYYLKVDNRDSIFSYIECNVVVAVGGYW